MSTPTQQVAAIETARRILLGGVKLPSPASAQARLLAEQLADASKTITGATQ